MCSRRSVLSLSLSAGLSHPLPFIYTSSERKSNTLQHSSDLLTFCSVCFLLFFLPSLSSTFSFLPFFYLPFSLSFLLSPLFSSILSYVCFFFSSPILFFSSLILLFSLLHFANCRFIYSTLLFFCPLCLSSFPLLCYSLHPHSLSSHLVSPSFNHNLLF